MLLEYKLLASNTPRHMYIYPNDDTSWSGLLYIHTGLYKGAVIQFTIVFENYPDQGPKLYVQTQVYHPLIDRNGVFDYSYQFKTWKASKDHIFHLLHFFNNSFREDVLLMINSIPIDSSKVVDSLREQRIQGLGTIPVKEIDDETCRRMRQILFE